MSKLNYNLNHSRLIDNSNTTGQYYTGLAIARNMPSQKQIRYFYGLIDDLENNGIKPCVRTFVDKVTISMGIDQLKEQCIQNNIDIHKRDNNEEKQICDLSKPPELYISSETFSENVEKEKKKFIVKKTEESVNRTFRFPKSLMNNLTNVAKNNNVSLNSLVIQCCEFALKELENE